MGVKWKTKKSEFPQMISSLQALGDRSIEVGAISGEHAWL